MTKDNKNDIFPIHRVLNSDSTRSALMHLLECLDRPVLVCDASIAVPLIANYLLDYSTCVLPAQLNEAKVSFQVNFHQPCFK